ncbi:lytic polysaccharide monooxygenase [Trichoderma longibrachiatum ATCC 18648]|uniref:Lytic polysaccharide monooxygenase n=1 Tax=Trichoderma longibrachiatum ATCC 18648 TaxID=983965 RepID=A0A2T4CB55_TRILO|nr:lytic polysaccharide monooxygenase [Trichoderma longibrachiatum ATCC 18648]
MYSKLFTIAALASAASAHMKMSNPVPYGQSGLDNAPLKPDGSDFPCKIGGSGSYNLEGASNVFAQGSTQQLSFVGSAVHGGGSCQVSVTTDAQPDKNSVWKVIKSIEGGCPAQDQVGNMGDNAAEIDPYKYNFTIPDELASGKYTLAWTWFNKVGNREMYMNCAPLTVTGSGGSSDFLNTLPDMFVANIFGDEKCNTVDDKDLEFPDPGTDVVRMNGATTAFAAAAFTQFCPFGFGASASVQVPAPTAAPQPTAAPAQPSPSVSGGVFITKPIGGQAPASQPAAPQPTAASPAAPQPPASQPAAAAPAVTSAPVVNSPVPSQAPAATPSAAPAPPSSGSGSGSGSAFAAGTACSSEGQWNCIGGSQFQRCASGTWSAVQSLAAGTECQAGQADNLKMVTKRGKKSMRRAKRS